MKKYYLLIDLTGKTIFTGNYQEIASYLRVTQHQVVACHMQKLSLKGFYISESEKETQTILRKIIVGKYK